MTYGNRDLKAAARKIRDEEGILYTEALVKAQALLGEPGTTKTLTHEALAEAWRKFFEENVLGYADLFDDPAQPQSQWQKDLLTDTPNPGMLWRYAEVEDESVAIQVYFQTPHGELHVQDLKHVGGSVGDAKLLPSGLYGPGTTPSRPVTGGVWSLPSKTRSLHLAQLVKSKMLNDPTNPKYEFRNRFEISRIEGVLWASCDSEGTRNRRFSGMFDIAYNLMHSRKGAPVLLTDVGMPNHHVDPVGFFEALGPSWESISRSVNQLGMSFSEGVIPGIGKGLYDYRYATDGDDFTNRIYISPLGYDLDSEYEPVLGELGTEDLVVWIPQGDGTWGYVVLEVKNLKGLAFEGTIHPLLQWATSNANYNQGYEVLGKEAFEKMYQS